MLALKTQFLLAKSDIFILKWTEAGGGPPI